MHTASDDASTPDPTDRLTSVAILAAPVLLATSTIAYALAGDMNRGEIGGVVQFYALTLFAIAVVGLVAPLRRPLPRTSAVLLATGLAAATAGASYGIDSIWAAVSGQPQLVDQGLTSGLIAMAPAAVLLPVTLIGLGLALARLGLVPPPAGYLLAVAAVMFPTGRATNLLVVALATDGVLLVSLVTIGQSLARRGHTAVARPRTASGHSPSR